jgi:signal transduction histidine kinase
MKTYFRSFYARLSALFLLLLVLFGVLQVLVTINSHREFVRESDQRLNYGLAADLAKQFHPYLSDRIDKDAIYKKIHDLMVMNPYVEIYLLNRDGGIEAYFADPAKIKRKSVDIAPVRQFLGEQASFPLYGDDPRDADHQKTFSAAQIELGPKGPGYLYVILGGEQYDSASAMISESYIIQTTAVSLGLALVCTGGVGLVLFFFLTRRLRNVTDAVQAFRQGDWQRRVAGGGGGTADEIGELGSAFNQMAATIAANIERLRHADSLRRELVANVSHDLRSPLTSVQGYIETILLKDNDLNPEQRRRYLETVAQNVRFLGRLVNELFELSTLETQQTRPKFEAISIEELAQDVALKYLPQARQRNIDLEPPPPAALPLVYADISMIERTLDNLIDNALRFTPPGGRIEIGLEKKDTSICIRVADSGHGIPPEDLPHIFDRFYRAPKGPSLQDSGTGLGLAISRKIVEAHGDTLRVESQIKQGTTFTFSLPTDAAPTA